MSISLKIIEFCAKECERQRSGEMSVYRMVLAYKHAQSLEDIQEWDILDMAKIIEPEKNKNGYRRIPVTFRDGGTAIHHSLIDRQMKVLLHVKDMITPIEFYKEFEEIHGFAEGNGRLGAILYCWASGCLLNPVHPPDVFK